MKNNQYSTYDVKRVCESKLSIEFRCEKECNGWFEYEGKRIARITIPKGRKLIPPSTYASMAKQLKLEVGRFDELLDCPLALKEYLEILRSQSVI